MLLLILCFFIEYIVIQYLGILPKLRRVTGTGQWYASVLSCTVISCELFCTSDQYFFPVRSWFMLLVCSDIDLATCRLGTSGCAITLGAHDTVF